MPRRQVSLVEGGDATSLEPSEEGVSPAYLRSAPVTPSGEQLNG
jgi:hypothetical protein